MVALSPYDIDRELGLWYYVTSSKGIGGKLRLRPEDFVVNELVEDIPTVEGGAYTYFILEKKNWDTIRAIKTIAKTLKISYRRFSFAGTKDRRALARQLVCAYKVAPENLLRLRIRDMGITGVFQSDQRLGLGSLKGNSFVAIIREVEDGAGELEENLRRNIRELKESGVPNYFGYQRFGVVRPLTHKVGRAIVKGRLEEAVMTYLAEHYAHEPSLHAEARRRLSEERDFRKALSYYPKNLNYERIMLHHLAKHPRDFAGAIRRIPRTLAKMFVHAYQSYIFNVLLSTLIKDGAELMGLSLPVVGFGSFPENSRGWLALREIMDGEGIKLEDFKVRKIPELASRGGVRSASVEADISFSLQGCQLDGKTSCCLSFTLPKGSYASVVLREIMKTNPINY
jgi:tRNA pseudouridine13 synthase